MESLIHSLFALSPAVRYVALLRGKELELQERPGLSAPARPRLTGTRSCW
jgi:hypothetical protein